MYNKERNFSRSSSSSTQRSDRSSNGSTRSPERSSTKRYSDDSGSSSNSGGYGRSNQKYSQSTSFSSGRRSFSGGGSGFNRRRGSFRLPEGGDYSKYVKKAIPNKPVEIYVPKYNFADFKITESLKKNIIGKGYVTPTPIQDQSIPYILEGKDVIGIANTGTGKTAAFLIPLINKILLKREAGIEEKVLVIVPTRELAVQISDELFGFSKFLNIRAVSCIGGASIGEQIYKLRGKYNFVIGTPGRLKDLVNRDVLKLQSFSNIVLDEVDRMVDMGFINDIKYLLAELPDKKQSLFFSATVSKDIDVLIRKFLNNPITISVKTQQTAENVDQDVVKYSTHEDKLDKLHDILIKEEVKKTLIFVQTKIGADRLDNELFKKGFKVTAIHGDLSQYRRQQSLNKFKENKVEVLVATDVAARGLDIPNVTHVINYDVPATYEDYIHRIGRTGRANMKGNALTFVK